MFRTGLRDAPFHKKGKKCAGNRLRGIPVPGMKYTSCYGYVFYFCFSSFSNKIRAF